MDRVRSQGRSRLGVGIALLVAALLMSGLAPGSSSAELERSGRRRQMLGLTNHDRVRHERQALDFAGRLSRYAKHHSRVMAEAGYLFHSTGDELRAALDGYEWSIGGENIGVGGSLESLEDAFMASKAHRRNILRKPYENAAFGIVRADGRVWVTVIFYG